MWIITEWWCVRFKNEIYFEIASVVSFCVINCLVRRISIYFCENWVLGSFWKFSLAFSLFLYNAIAIFKGQYSRKNNLSIFAQNNNPYVKILNFAHRFREHYVISKRKQRDSKLNKVVQKVTIIRIKQTIRGVPSGSIRKTSEMLRFITFSFHFKWK